MSHLFSAPLEDSAELIQWKIGDTGFEMTLSGEVPGRIQHALEDEGTRKTLYNGWGPDQVTSWAVHAGGRSILDAVEKGLELPQGSLWASRDVLARYGNMSSATLMFVLAELIGRPDTGKGVAIAFGPGPRRRGLPLRAGCMSALSVRSRQAEQMDDPGARCRNLRGGAARSRPGQRLDRLGARPTLNFLARGLGDVPAFRLLDVGFGHGDMLRADRALGEAPGHRRRPDRRRSQSQERRHRAARRRRSTGRSNIAPATIATSPGRSISSSRALVTHHMSDDEIHAFLALHGGARRARLDGQRHPPPRLSPITAFPCSAAADRRWHRIVREDGQLSIARGFRPADWRALIDEAGLPDPAAPRIVRRFPFRLCVERLR